MSTSVENPVRNQQIIVDANLSINQYSDTSNNPKDLLARLDVFMAQMLGFAERFSSESGPRNSTLSAADNPGLRGSELQGSVNQFDMSMTSRFQASSEFSNTGSLKLPEPFQQFFDELAAIQSRDASSVPPLSTTGSDARTIDHSSAEPLPEKAFRPVWRGPANEVNPALFANPESEIKSVPQGSADAVNPFQGSSVEGRPAVQITDRELNQIAPWLFPQDSATGNSVMRDQVSSVMKAQAPEAEEKPFSIINEKLDPFTTIMLLQEERVGLLEGQVRSQSNRMQEINKEIKGLGSLIGDVNQLSSGLKKGDDKTQISDGLRQQLTDAGVDIPGGEVSKDQLNAMGETLKSKRDGLNNDSQMEMIRLQGLLNKQQQAYQLMSTIQKKEHELIMSTIRNINA